MTKAMKIARAYLDGEPVDLADMIPELLDQIQILSLNRKGWTQYLNILRRAVKHKEMVESRK